MFFLPQDYQAVIVVKHKGSKGDNPHYHAVVKTQVKDQAFRVRLRKVFDQGKGNAHMSIKPWDGNIDAISYLFHELSDEQKSNEVIVYVKDVSDETIGKARDRNREVRQKVDKAKQKASWTIEEELLEHYRLTGVKPGEHTIATDIVLHALRRDKYVPNDFLLKAMASKIRFKLMDGNLKREEDFAKELVIRAYRMDDNQREYFLAEGEGV